MRIRHIHEEGEKIELQMTPMIDIVFQLLVFFIMTFKIVAQEGDFNIRMPRAAPNSDPTIEEPPPQLTLMIYLTAGQNGGLAGVKLNEEEIQSAGDIFSELNDRIVAMVNTSEPGQAQDAEVELGFDYDLKYEYVVSAITAVTGYLDEDDKPVKLIEKIKFSPPDPERAGG